MASTDFLFELGCEELPARLQDRLAQTLANAIAQALDAGQLSYKTITPYSTPRRLAVSITDLATEQPKQSIEKRGPSVKAAFDDAGKPTQACLGFAESLGVTINVLETLKTDKGEWLLYRGEQAGKKAEALLPDIIVSAIKQLPIGKSMVWQDETPAFPRPVRWLVSLLGNQVLPLKSFGLDASNKSYGHAVHAPQAITLEKASDYIALLKSAKVLVEREKRKQLIVKELKKLEDRGLKIAMNTALLDEVTGLVEWPRVHLGHFDASYLTLPQDVLIKSMNQHQKYFAVFDEKGKLSPTFAVVANIVSQDKKRMLHGYERVLAARLADAHFFYDTDQKTPIADYVAQEKRVTFQAGLGSIHDKSERIAALAKQWAPKFNVDAKMANQAGLWCKFDLMTDMVDEFPSLQGVIGGIYAENQGIDSEITQAISEHYRPSYAGDALPSTPMGQLISLADKIDSLMGLFALGKIPSGTKDPFALRRQALGVIRMLVESQLDFDLAQGLADAAKALPLEVSNEQIHSCLQFCLERLKAWYLEQGETPEIMTALLQSGIHCPYDLHRRLQAMKAFLQSPSASALCAANKRIDNLLKKQKNASGEIDPSLLQADEEKQLFDLMKPLQSKVAKCLQDKDYTTALEHVATLRGPVDAFFEKVMVMDENPDMKKNRLALLSELARLCHCVMPIASLVN